MQEIWKSLKDIECGENYEISNLGNIRNKNGKYLKYETNEKGYFRVGLYFNKKRKMYRVHRLVALMFIPNKNNKPEVNHKDGNKQNNYSDNLEWSTRKDNVQHSFDNNLNPTKGEGSSTAKLTNNDVREIRKLYATGEYTHRSLAEMFDVNHSSIGSIIRGEKWKHVI